MTTAQQIALALIIIFGASIALALLWGKFVNVGRGETRYAPDHTPASNTTVLAKIKAQHEWEARLTGNIADCRAELKALAGFPGSPEVVARKTMLHVLIDGDEHVLGLLRERGETMATLTEGRM